MMGSSLDDLTRVLFARIRQENNEPENALLKCPKCPNRLKPLLLDIYEEDGQSYQRVWWICRGLKSKTCIYPLNMPTQVFWTRRTEEQIRQDVIPLPNFNLLPKEYWKLYPTLFKSPTQQSTKSRIEMQVSSETPATGDHEKRDDEVEIIEDEHSFDSLKKREETRKKRKSRARIPRDEDGRTPGKKKFKGVVLTRQPADPSTRSKNGDSNALRKPLPLRPVEERTVTGGRNFDFKIVEEATKQKQVSNRVQIFTDIQSNLKTALALRFAKKEFTDRLTEVISENVPVIQKDEINLYAKREMLQRVSEKFPMIMETPAPIIKREKRSRSESRQPGTPEEDSDINKDIGFVMTKKAIESFKKMEQASTLSSRLGIKVEDFDTCSKRPPSTLRTDLYGRVPQVNSGSATNDSSSIASGQEVPDNESPDPKSQEISASVQRHIQTLKAKMERQRKKKVHKRKRQEVVQQVPHEPVYPDNQNQFINYDGYEHQQELHYQEPDGYNVDESDYGIFGDGEELW